MHNTTFFSSKQVASKHVNATLDTLSSGHTNSSVRFLKSPVVRGQDKWIKALYIFFCLLCFLIATKWDLKVLSLLVNLKAVIYTTIHSYNELYRSSISLESELQRNLEPVYWTSYKI